MPGSPAACEGAAAGKTALRKGLRVSAPGKGRRLVISDAHTCLPFQRKPRVGRKQGRRGKSPDGQVAWCHTKSTGSTIHSWVIWARLLNFSAPVSSSTIKTGLKILPTCQSRAWRENVWGREAFAITVRGGRSERKWELERWSWGEPEKLSSAWDVRNLWHRVGWASSGAPENSSLLNNARHWPQTMPRECILPEGQDSLCIRGRWAHRSSA